MDDSTELKAVVIVTAAVIWSCAQPLVPFAPPLALLAAGATLAIALHLISGVKSPEAWDAKLAGPVLLLSLILFVYVVYQAWSEQHVTDQACKALQVDMLSSKPSRSNLTDIFKAFGCHYQA